MSRHPEAGLPEIAIVGELNQHEHEICDKLLAVPPGGECVLYFNSPGGSAYVALSLATLIAVRGWRRRASSWGNARRQPFGCWRPAASGGIGSPKR